MRTLTAFLCILLCSCSDQGPSVGLATLKLVVEPLGLDHPDAFTIVVDSGHTRLGLGVPATTSVVAGTRLIELRDLPRNCITSEDNPRRVQVAAKETREVRFVVTCTAVTGYVQSVTRFAGLDVPGTYVLRVGGQPDRLRLAADSVLHTELGGGLHTVSLANMPGNCAVADNPRSVVVTTGGLTRDTARTVFSVSCGAAFGVVETTIEVTGHDVDPTGLVLRVAGVGRQVNPVASGVVRHDVGSGHHIARIDSLAANCAVVGENPRTLSVVTGGQVRDTARTTFRITCAAVETMVFARYTRDGVPFVTRAHGDGSEAVAMVEGLFPSWSPDGSTILYTAVDCDFWYYYDCLTLGVATISTDGKRTIRSATPDRRDHQARWSPDGSKIAAIRGAQLIVMQADGSSPADVAGPNALPGMSGANSPSWSPDGSRIAFNCEFGGTQPQSPLYEICVVRADGREPTRLTNDMHYDSSPAWSPDGAIIAFHSDRDSTDPTRRVLRLMLMNPQGGDRVSLVEGQGPGWSRDGTRILFSRGSAGEGIYSIQRDGTGLARLTTGNDHGPSTRP